MKLPIIQILRIAIYLLLLSLTERDLQSEEVLLVDLNFTNADVQNGFITYQITNENSLSPTKGMVDLITRPGLFSLNIAAGHAKITVDGDNVYLKVPCDFSTNQFVKGQNLYDPVRRKIGGGQIKGDLYVSYLFRSQARNRNGNDSGLYFARRDNANSGMFAGISMTDQSVCLRDTSLSNSIDLKNFDGGGDYNVLDNGTHLMVLKFTYRTGHSNTITAWLDPDPEAGETNQNSPTTFTGTLAGNCSFDRIFLRGGNNHPMDFGDIRLGTSWDTVLPPNLSTNRFPKHNFQAWPKFFADQLQTNSTQGYTFLVLDHDKRVASGSSGFYRKSPNDEKTVPWNEAQVEHVASISKSITATAILKLWEEHRFSLDEPFWPYLKNLFPNVADSSKKITIRELLIHRSGLTESAADVPSTAKLLASQFNETPGAKNHYNNLNYYILRLLIEQISGEPYTQYVKTNVLKPAGVEDMDTKSKELPMWNAENFAGAIGWHGSTADLTKFLFALTQGKILMPVTVEKMFHEALGWDPIILRGQVIGYHKHGDWKTTEGKIEGADIAHFVDGIDVAMFANFPIDSQATLLTKVWQIDKSTQTSR